MTELCFGLFILVFVLAIVALVGHGLWLMAAAVVRSFSGSEPPGHAARLRLDAETCAQCGHSLAPADRYCEACGLDREGPAATELAELEATERRLHFFADDGALDRPTLRHLQERIEERRRLLGKRGERPARPSTPSRPVRVAEASGVVGLPARSPVQELEDLLAGCEDVRNLTLGNRKRALSLYHELPEDRLATLSISVQRTLARLLHANGWAGDALRAYGRLLESHPNESVTAEAALEAGRLALERNVPEQARWFLERAAARSVSPACQQQARELLQQLETPAQEEILDVLPVEAPAVASRPVLVPVPVPVSVPVPVPVPEAPVPVPAAPLVEARIRETPAPVVPSVEPPHPRPPRRSLGELLAGFMEERNILWGELVGGLLMVGCSIALVISLWNTLEKIPYSPFIIFAVFTAGVLGAGLYTLHHWKLESTSRGLLVIGTLLLPLNFLVLAGLFIQKQEHGGDSTSELLIRLTAEAASLALFALLGSKAARVLVPDGRRLFTVAVLGVSVCQLLVPRFVIQQQPTPWSFLLLGCLPVACFGLSTGGFLRQTARRQPLQESQANGVFAFLGIGTFALAVTLGFLVFYGGDIAKRLQDLAVPIALAGVPVLAGGLLVYRGLAEDAGTAGARTTGTGIALAGMLIMLLAVVLAWPAPLTVLLVCAVNFTVLTTVAFGYRLPLAHAVALPCLAVGYLTAFHLLAGRLTESSSASFLQLLFEASSGTALVALVAVLGAAAEWAVRAGHRPHGVYYAAGSGVAALLSVLLVTVRGVADPAHATVVYGIYAAGSLAMNLRWQRPFVGYIGVALLLGTTLWGLHWGWPGRDHFPLWSLTLAAEALVMAALPLLLGARVRSRPAPDEAWRMIAQVAAILALPLAIGSPAFPEGAWHTYTAALLAATTFALAWPYRAPALTLIGSLLLLVSTVHAFAWDFAALAVARPGLMAILTHATLTLLAAVLIKAKWGASREDAAEAAASARAARVKRIFVEPLHQAALLSSVLALVPLFMWQWGEMTALALFMGWLAVVWLLAACVHRSPALFTAFQAALHVSMLYAVTAWLRHQAWVEDSFEGLWDPRSLQAFGVGLALLAFLSVAARRSFQSNRFARDLMRSEAALPGLDQAVFGLLVLAQLVLAVWGVVPDVVRELAPVTATINVGWPAGYAHAHGPGAWILLASLAAVMVLSLWERRPAATLVGLLVLALTVPVLAAGSFADELATASALRWGLALCFLACSALLWVRESVQQLAASAGVPAPPAYPLSALVRRLLVASSVLPVLGLTLAVAVVGFSGTSTTGPAPGSYFARVGWVASNVTPLLLVSLGLVGHALRERSAGYAFAGGLVANVSLMGGYALQVITGGGHLGGEEWVHVLQLGSLGAAVWALAWLASRRWVQAWREALEAPLAGPLMSAQIGMAVAGNALLLLVAVGLLVLPIPLDAGVAAMPIYPAAAAWTKEAGSVLGLLAFLLAFVAADYRTRQGHALLSPTALGLVGLAVFALAACTTANQTSAAWGYRTFMLGSALYALLWALAVWSLAGRRWAAPAEEDTTRPAVFDPTSLLVRVAGMLAILLGIKAAVWHQDHLCAAAAIAVASTAGAVMAVRERREDWAFLTGLGVNLATSLVVWHFHLRTPLSDWWVLLVQANVITSALVALAWMETRQRLYDPLELRLSSGWVLHAQIGLTFLGNAVLLLLPLGGLFLLPGTLPAQTVHPDLEWGWLGLIVRQAGQVWGWLAVFLAVTVAARFNRQAGARGQVYLGAIFGLALGVLAACLISPWDRGDWLAYHLLTVTWTITGVVILAIGWAGLDRGFPTRPLRAVLEVIGILVVVLALRGAWDDPLKPYWSSGATLAVSALAAALAVWCMRSRGTPAPDGEPLVDAIPRRIPYVDVSGVLVCVAGSIAWLAWGPSTVTSFLSTNVICLGITSAFWTVTELILRRHTAGPAARDYEGPYRHLSALLGLTALALLTAAGIASDLGMAGWHVAGPLEWTALGVVAFAILLSLWDAEASFVTSALYTTGLVALGLTLHRLELSPERLCWMAALLLAGYVFATAFVGVTTSQNQGFGRFLRLPDQPAGWWLAWFLPAQAVAAGVVVALSVWMSLGFDATTDRLAGPLAAAMLLLAGVLLADFWEGDPAKPGSWGLHLRYSALAVGVLVLAELGWASLDPAHAALWLHRSVWLMVALAVMTLVYGIGLMRLLPASSAWVDCGRRLGPMLGGLAALVVLAVLVQEGALYDRTVKRAPVALPATIVMGVALAALIVAAIGFAVLPDRDPLGLPEQRRTLYVYAAEGILVLLFLHLRLTSPQLFGHFGAKFWTFIVMGLAFAGFGLSEFFQRRGLRVLAEPLQRTGIFLPLLPLLAFWLRVPQETHDALREGFPGLEPLLGYLPKGEHAFGHYALLWFLLGGLYGWMAVTTRSFRFALCAALAANIGLWALLHNYGLAFLVHPQMWLIPLAVILLVSEHVNRDRLSPQQSATLRYLALSLLYVSSTADMFIAGLDNWWLPLVLALLSVLGVLAGIVLRVRAFLFLGVTFLSLVIFTMIWHAAVDYYHTWVWWVSGIVLGAGIIALFAVFEKRRDDMLRLLEEIRQWD